MKNTCRRSRPAALQFEQIKEPDQVVMHRAVVTAEPVNQRLDVELRRFAAHRVRTIDIDGFAGGQSVGEFFWGMAVSVEAVAATERIIFLPVWSASLKPTVSAGDVTSTHQT